MRPQTRLRLGACLGAPCRGACRAAGDAGPDTIHSKGIALLAVLPPPLDTRDPGEHGHEHVYCCSTVPHPSSLASPPTPLWATCARLRSPRVHVVWAQQSRHSWGWSVSCHLPFLSSSPSQRLCQVGRRTLRGHVSNCAGYKRYGEIPTHNISPVDNGRLMLLWLGDIADGPQNLRPGWMGTYIVKQHGFGASENSKKG